MDKKFSDLIILLASGINQRAMYFDNHPKVQSISVEFKKRLSDLLDSGEHQEFSFGVFNGKFVRQGKYLVGPSIAHPAATMSSVASSSAKVGTAATTSASAVATSVIVPVPSGSTVMSTLRSTRHPASAATQTHRARMRRTTMRSMADEGR